MDKPRCDKHRTNELAPAACHICSRIRVEQRIVIKTVNALLKAGYTLNVYNGGDENELSNPTRDKAALLGALMNTDDDYLMVYTNPEPETEYKDVGWVRFVYGNDGWDVISDYTTNLDKQLEPIEEFANKLGGN